MAITINKRPLYGGGVIFTSETAQSVAQAIKEMGNRAYLSGAYLTGADLTGADLTGADLRGAYLSGAYLSGAYLTGAYLTGADLSGAYLRGAYLRGAYLTGADLSGAYLRGAYLRGAYLSGADLTGAYLTGAYLTGAYLTGADLSGVIAPWGSHDFMAEVLRCDADGDPQKRMVAGLILVSRDWCWEQFAALDIAPDLKEWAFRTLSAWAWKSDAYVPNELYDWMEKNGVDRPVRPVVEVAPIVAQDAPEGEEGN